MNDGRHFLYYHSEKKQNQNRLKEAIKANVVITLFSSMSSLIEIIFLVLNHKA